MQSPTCTLPIRQKNQPKAENQGNDIWMAEAERTAPAVETILAHPGLGQDEKQEILKDKEEFSLLAKKKLVEAAKYKRSLKSALLKLEAVHADYQSLRATAEELQKAIVALTRCLDLIQESINRLFQGLDRMEEENSHWRARMATQKDINKDFKAAIRNLQE